MADTSPAASCPTSTTQDPKLDPSTFVPPSPLPHPRIVIEFCDRVKRSLSVVGYIELLVSVVPLNSEDTAGRFRVWLEVGEGAPILIWDRKVNGGFPELKELVSKRGEDGHIAVFTLPQKQRIRDHVQPSRSLGHSDRKSE
ncbi:hypothetical protein JVU11DRAFT_1418 [Chiua virens]|nr:hypothetical protein JVU11DRAFT_1418 [Chiua virens]